MRAEQQGSNKAAMQSSGSRTISVLMNSKLQSAQKHWSYCSAEHFSPTIPPTKYSLKTHVEISAMLSEVFAARRNNVLLQREQRGNHESRSNPHVQ